MKKLTLTLCLLLMITLIPPNAFGRNKLESWYTYWGLGYAGVTYPDEVQEALDELKEVPGVSQMSLSLDLLGFYWPVGERMILGGIVNSIADRYEAEGEDMTIGGYIYSISAMHFLTNRIGQGLFVRADLGPARLVIDSSVLDQAEASDWGFGASIGGGFGIPITDGTRILINAKYSIRKIEEENYNNFEISVGGLF